MSDSIQGGVADRQRVLAAVLAVVVVGSAATAGVAAAAGTASASASTAAGDNPIKFVYVDGDTSNVTFVRADGTRVGTNRSADVVGAMADLDGDGNLEAPFVTSQGEIWAVDANNETQFVANETYNSKTKLGVGDWTGDGTPEVVYANTSDNQYLYYANTSGTPTRVTSASAQAVFGVEDFDGDGTLDVVYQGSGSGNLWYYDGSSTVDTQYGNMAESGAGGAPRDFDRDGELRVPSIDGSGYPELVNASGDVDQLKQSNQDKTPVAGVDWAGDSRLEVVHLKSSQLSYTYLNGTTKTLYDAGGNSIGANQGAGVAGVAVRSETVLSVTEFRADSTGSQNVTVTVETNEDLNSLDVSLSGAENASLSLGDFAETSTSPYTYEATVNGSTDGDYTANLDLAESADGDTVTDSQSDSVTVDDAAPSVDSVSLADAADGDGTVTAGDEVTVTATVTGDVGSVSADLSGFGAGTVALSAAGGDTYSATVDVTDGATSGDQGADVTASDGQGNSDAATTGTLTVDASVLTVAVADERTVDEDEQASFSVQSVENATGDVDVEWSFGDGGTRTGEDVVYTFVTPGTYEVTVTATDESGETARASMAVVVDDTGSSSGGSDSTADATTTDAPSDTTTASDTETTASGTETTAQSTDTTQTTDTTETTDTTQSGATTEQAGTTERTDTTERATSTEGAGTTASPDGQTPGEAPGFGAVAAVVAVAAAALLARRT